MADFLKEAVKAALPESIRRAILKTAIMREGNTFPAPDTRPTEVLAAEAELRKLGPDRAIDFVASKAFGGKINTMPVSVHTIKPSFTGVLVAVKPYGHEGDTVPGMKDVSWGTPILCVVSKSKDRAGGSKWRSGSLFLENIQPTTQYFVPGTDEQVKAAVERLYAARPAGTLSLFGIKFDGGVQAITAGEEE